MIIIIVLIITLILWNKPLINFTQSTERKCTTPKEIEEIIKSLKKVLRDIHIDNENKIPFVSSPQNYIHAQYTGVLGRLLQRVKIPDAV